MSHNDLAGSIRRTAWVPVLVGGLCGALTGVIQAFVVGLPDQALWLACFDGAAGLVLGTVSMTIVLIMTASLRSRKAAGVASLLVSMLIAALAAFWLTYGFLLIPMVTAAALTVFAHVTAARRVRTPLPETGTPSSTLKESDTPSPRASRILLLIGGGILALVLSTAAVDTLREGIHYGCSYGTMGEATGSWACADGIGYIFPGLGLLLGSGLSLLAGMIVALGDLACRTVRRILAALAFVPLIWTTTVLATATLGRSDPLPTGETWGAVWLFTVGIPALVALLGTAMGSASALTRLPDNRILRMAALALLLAATLIQPGLGLATAAVAALLIASWLDAQHPPSDAARHDALHPGIR
ncbi:MAG: hypothetical protein WAK00_14600 [Microbacterium sp.]|uniref:hypothetical protein n=1 Tax=Microbacterium sp. TaxID=51671 RepID=UPI003BAF751C